MHLYFGYFFVNRFRGGARLSSVSAMLCLGSGGWWSLSPGGFGGSGAYVWYVDSGYLGNARVNNSGGLRPVISLISSTNVTGNGTSDKPYKVI